MHRIGWLVLLVVAGLLLPPPEAWAGSSDSPAAHARRSCGKSDGTFKIKSQRIDAEPSGNTGVYLDLQNRTRTWRGPVRIQVCFFDAAGRLVDNGLTFSDQIAVAPRQRISTYISDSPPSTWDHLTVRLRSDPTRLRAVSRKVKVKAGAPAVVDGYFQLPVTVTNKNAFRIKHVAVYVSLFDASGTIISSDLSTYNYTDPRNLRPHKSGTYLADAFADFEGVQRVSIQVEAFRG
jgi:hypothetical protein